MCNRRPASLTLALICLFALTLGVAHGQAGLAPAAVATGRSAAQEPPPSASLGPDMPPPSIGARMTYQGRLTENGAPANGERQMTFRLCGDVPGATCSPVWTEGPKSITVSNGLFTTLLGDSVPLPVGSFAYPVTLEVQVGSQNLPRQVLAGAPYAMSLAPGARIYGLIPDPGYVFGLFNYSGGGLDASGFGTAVRAASVTGRAIDASSSSEGWDNATLYVRNSSTNGGAAANIAGQGLPPALILQNSYPGNDASGAALYAATNGGPVIRGMNAAGTQELFSVQGNGDIYQARPADGAVKAAVFAWCAGSGAAITRSFGPPASSIVIGSGGTPGRCTFDFGFTISDRFFTASAVSSNPVVVACDYVFMHDPNLQCQVTNLAGTGVDGSITIVIY